MSASPQCQISPPQPDPSYSCQGLCDSWPQPGRGLRVREKRRERVDELVILGALLKKQESLFLRKPFLFVMLPFFKTKPHIPSPHPPHAPGMGSASPCLWLIRRGEDTKTKSRVVAQKRARCPLYLCEPGLFQIPPHPPGLGLKCHLLREVLPTPPRQKTTTPVYPHTPDSHPSIHPSIT